MIAITLICIGVIILIVVLVAKANEEEAPTHKPVVRDIAKEQRTLRVNIDKFIKEYGRC